MNLPRLFGKEKPVPFTQFCELVRLALRRQAPGATIRNTEDGFIFTLDDKPTNCNLRNLYGTYYKKPADRDALIQMYIDSAVSVVPAQGWTDAKFTLRPALKSPEYLAGAQAYLRKHGADTLPFAPFVGDLSVIIMRDLPGTAVAVTQQQLEDWGGTFESVMRAALDNMNLLSFPPITNTLLAGGTSRHRNDGEIVGLVFEGDHLTATWLIIERFRDHLSQKLQGDYVIAVPHRNRLVAVRADEPGLINSIFAANRNLSNDHNALTQQQFHVSASTTGGIVSVYDAKATGALLNADSLFAAGAPAPVLNAPPPGRPTPIDLSLWGGLSESTIEAPAPERKINDVKRGRR